MSRASGVAVAAAVLACCSVSAEAAHARDWKPTLKQATIARIVVATDVRARAGAGAVEMRLRTQAQWTGGPVRLLVLDGRRARGKLWLRVRLPARPNHASGWVNADHLVTTTTRWRVVIRTRARRVLVYRSGRLVRSVRAVVGTDSTPTPRGLFAIWEEARQPQRDGFLGPWALHLTAHSTVLENFGGGAGRVAIHGRSGASLLDPLGTARSHGCVRIDNGDVRWLARKLLPGTPVRIAR